MTKVTKHEELVQMYCSRGFHKDKFAAELAVHLAQIEHRRLVSDVPTLAALRSCLKNGASGCRCDHAFTDDDGGCLTRYHKDEYRVTSHCGVPDAWKIDFTEAGHMLNVTIVEVEITNNGKAVDKWLPLWFLLDCDECCLTLIVVDKHGNELVLDDARLGQLWSDQLWERNAEVRRANGVKPEDEPAMREALNFYLGLDVASKA